MRNFRFVLLSIFVLIRFYSVLGQNNTVDNLLKALRTEKVDTTKISICIALGDYFEQSNADSNRYFTATAIDLTKDLFKKKRNPKHGVLLAQYQTRLGDIFYQQKKYEKAIEYYFQSIKTFENFENSDNSEIARSAKNGIINGNFYLGRVYAERENSDKSIEFYLEAIKLMEKISDYSGMARGYNNIGTVYYYQGNLPMALEYYGKSKEIRQQINDINGISNCYINIGIVYTDQGKFEKAIDCYIKALKYKEEIDDKRGIAHCFNNIGNLHADQNSLEKAIEYYLKALVIREGIDDKEGVSGCYTNIGLAYSELGKYDKALEYYNKAIPVYIAISNKSGLADNYNNMGIVYRNKSELFKAMEFFKKTLDIREKINDSHGKAAVISNIAATYAALSKIVEKEKSVEYLKLSLKYGLDALDLAKKIGSLTLQKAIIDGLVTSYKLNGNYLKALEFAELGMISRDSLYNEEKTKALAEMEIHYLSDKKQQEIEKQNLQLENQQIIISNAEWKNRVKNIYLLIILAALVLTIIIICYIFKSRQRQVNTNKLLMHLNAEILQQKKEIIAQSEEIELQNRNITNSIEYAGYIQKAVLTDPQTINEVFNDFFLIYKPCQVLSGDFYLVKQNEQSIYIVIADSMGHGVPGSLISMLGYAFLNEIVHNKISSHSNLALEEMREKVKITLNQTGKIGGQDDSIEIAFCIINKTSKKLHYSGARIPLWLVRHEDEEMEPILEIFEPDPQPVGIYVKEMPFTEKIIQLYEGDIIYIFTDGITSQFGGKKGQRLMEKQLREIVLAKSHKDMTEQGVNLESAITEWKGKNDQIDDILAFGVRI